jgi:hypothetical protein
MNLQLLVRQFERYRRRELLIDTNLLLLYFVGALRPDRIGSFNRTSGYSTDDFALVERVMSAFKRGPKARQSFGSLTSDRYASE